MKIVEVRVFPMLTVPRTYPTVISMPETGAAPTARETSPFIIFELISDSGLRGIGEISDIPEDIIPDPEWVKAELERALVGRDPYDVAGLIAGLPFPPWKNRTADAWLYQAAVDMALLDLQGKAAGVPIYALFGGKRRKDIEISPVIY